MLVGGETFLYIAFYFCISRRTCCTVIFLSSGLLIFSLVYSNCLLASLNGRKAIRRAGRGDHGLDKLQDFPEPLNFVRLVCFH